MISAVLDLNVLVSALLTPRGSPRQVLAAWQARRFDVMTSEGIIAETEQKLRDPKVGRAYGVTEDDVGRVGALLRTQAVVVLVPPALLTAVTGDPEDDYVLATAALGNVVYMITGDRRLLALGDHAGAKNVSPRAFLEILGQG